MSTNRPYLFEDYLNTVSTWEGEGNMELQPPYKFSNMQEAYAKAALSCRPWGRLFNLPWLSKDLITRPTELDERHLSAYYEALEQLDVAIPYTLDPEFAGSASGTEGYNTIHVVTGGLLKVGRVFMKEFSVSSSNDFTNSGTSGFINLGALTELWVYDWRDIVIYHAWPVFSHIYAGSSDNSTCYLNWWKWSLNGPPGATYSQYLRPHRWDAGRTWPEIDLSWITAMNMYSYDVALNQWLPGASAWQAHDRNLATYYTIPNNSTFGDTNNRLMWSFCWNGPHYDYHCRAKYIKIYFNGTLRGMRTVRCGSGSTRYNGTTYFDGRTASPGTITLTGDERNFNRVEICADSGTKVYEIQIW